MYGYVGLYGWWFVLKGLGFSDVVCLGYPGKKRSPNPHNEDPIPIVGLYLINPKP